MIDLRDRLALWLATGGYTGYARIAPGTAGSLVGLLFYLPVATRPAFVQIVLVGTLFCVGVWASERAEKIFRITDPHPVVIDEIVGMWISLLFLPHTPGYFLAAFFLFRLFDVLKPFPAKQAEHLAGGWGIMADDVIAALYANVVLQAVQIFRELPGGP
jgi:phosphatidylglycerophosphatase A